ncbi:MAG: catalase family protein [Janthinobacterium lividum]
MPRYRAALRFHPSFEAVPADEDQTQQGLTEAMLSIQRKTHADEGHAFRAVHAKAHGYVRATFEVLPGLSAELAQGLYARPGTYDAVLRFSTTPGDILHDDVSTPRGAALKVLGVSGERLPGSEGATTQDYVLGNSPSFQVATAEGFLKQLRVLAASTGHSEPVKHIVSILSRNANAALDLVGQKSATLTTLAGQAPTELLGDGFYSQAALLHGDYYAKVAIVPVSSDLVALAGRPLDLAGHPDAIRESVQRFFRSCPATWELRVQLATDIDKMPIEDAATIWPESERPYLTVARITAVPQDSWSDGRRAYVEDHLAFSPWTGLAAHRPLGSIMRARRPAYAAARAYRAQANGARIDEPVRLAID